MQNGSTPLNKMAARAPDKKYIKTTSPPVPLVQIFIYLHMNVPHEALFKIA